MGILLSITKQSSSLLNHYSVFYGVSMKVGDIIKYWRKEYKLSQNKLAEMIGSTQQTVSRWEANQNIPSIVDCVKLAKALQLSLDEMFADIMI